MIRISCLDPGSKLPLQIATRDVAFGRIWYSSSSILASKEIGLAVDELKDGTSDNAGGSLAMLLFLIELRRERRSVVLPLSTISKYTPTPIVRKCIEIQCLKVIQTRYLTKVKYPILPQKSRDTYQGMIHPFAHHLATTPSDLHTTEVNILKHTRPRNIRKEYESMEDIRVTLIYG